MNVTIDSGPVSERDYLRDVPQARWFELMQVRRGFLRIHLTYDCRRLLEFVEDADKMYAPLGFASADDFIERGLELDAQDVAWAVEGLRRLKPNEPIPFKKAVELGKRGGDRRSAAFKDAIKDQGSDTTLIGRGRTYLLARLDRDRPDLAARVRSKELSANAAAIEAGFRKNPTPVERMRKLWRKMSAAERAAFRAWQDNNPETLADRIRRGEEISAEELLSVYTAADHAGVLYYRMLTKVREQRSLTELPGTLKDIIKTRAWQNWRWVGSAFGQNSLGAYLTKPPPNGVGIKLDTVEKLIADDPEALALYREEMTGQPHVHKDDADGDNVTIRAERGNSRAYTLDRLKRERPDRAAR